MARDFATHEALTRDEAPTGPSERSFGLVVGGVLLGIGAWPLLWGRSPRVWWAAAGAALVAAALAQPRLLVPLNRAWTALGWAMHRVVSPLVMGAIFFAVVLPIGLALRLAGKDLLRLKREPEAASYWIPRQPPGPTADSMRHQF